MLLPYLKPLCTKSDIHQISLPPQPGLQASSLLSILQVIQVLINGLPLASWAAV